MRMQEHCWLAEATHQTLPGLQQPGLSLLVLHLCQSPRCNRHASIDHCKEAPLFRPTHLSSLGFIMKKAKNQKEPYLPLSHHREVFYQVTAERDCTSSRNHPVESFVEVSVFSFCGSRPYRGHQKHPARREARFPEMQYCTTQRKSPSLDSFQAVYTWITNTKGV